MYENLDNPHKFPQQRLGKEKKGEKWRKACVDWGVYNLYRFSDSCRKSIEHKKINQDLVNGIVHMEDLESYVNPYAVDNKYNYDREPIQHYNLIWSKLNVLRGEEEARVFDYKVVATNPNTVSDIAESKKAQLMEELKSLVEDQGLDEQAYQQEVQKLSKYYTYNWQDIREIRGNAILNHYSKELNFKLLFNQGFMTALWSGEEVYRCYIESGEPKIEAVNPYKLTVLSSGSSNKIEDANIIIYNDYWPIEKVYDVYGDQLSEKDMKYLEERLYDKDDIEGYDHYYDFAFGKHFANTNVNDDSLILSDSVGEAFDSEWDANDINFSQLPFDMAGNVRVSHIWWKSRKKLKKVKQYDYDTGEVEFNIYNEAYIADKDRGEEEEELWANEAWHGVKIGTCVYVDMGPCRVQYNRLQNPSKCHFGFIGSVYSIHSNEPFTLVDLMKPYNYLYDVTFDRLKKAMATNMGKLVQMDLAKIPVGDGWGPEKWIKYAKTYGIAVVDSFKEGDYGAATGKLSGALNNNTSGVVDAELSSTMQTYIQMLGWLSEEMSTVSGISRQREGQTASRETVGGIERATAQSSYITNWLFAVHDDVKKRAIECFLETAKEAFREKDDKMQYIVPGWIQKIADIDGDEISECDYGIVVDNSKEVQELSQKLEMLVQAGIQNQLLNFSTALQIFSSCSIAEKVNIVRNAEQEQQEAQQQQQQQMQKMQQEQMEAQAQQEQMKMNHEKEMNENDNMTRIQVAEIQAEAKKDVEDGARKVQELDLKWQDMNHKFNIENEKMSLEREKLGLAKEKMLMEKEINQDDNKVKLDIAKIAAKNRSNGLTNKK